MIPVQRSLRDPSSAHMVRVLRLALGACAAIYFTVALSGGSSSACPPKRGRGA